MTMRIGSTALFCILMLIGSPRANAAVVISDWLTSHVQTHRLNVAKGDVHPLMLSGMRMGDIAEIVISPFKSSVEVEVLTETEVMGHAAQMEGLVTTIERQQLSDGNVKLNVTLARSEPHYLVVRNRSDDDVALSVMIRVSRKPTAEQRQEMIRVHEDFLVELHKVLDFPELTFLFASCADDRNAYFFPEAKTIKICSELVTSTNLHFPLAVMGSMLHELGHAMLFYWGLPGWDNEEMADAFATSLALRLPDTGKLILDHWLAYWDNRHKEFGEQEIEASRNGDPHMLSIQRATKIRTWRLEQQDVLQRWNRLMYPHMTTDTLKLIVQQPTSFDDLSAVKKELGRRQLVSCK